MRKHRAKVVEDELIMMLPADALESMGVPVGGQPQRGRDTVRGNMYIGGSPSGKNEPFPCFIRSVWDDQPVIKAIRVSAVRSMV